MTSDKEVVLNNVLHVLDIYKNLVSRSLLSENSFKLVFVYDKFVLIKNEMYVGKRYLYDGMFKMNVLTIVSKQSIMNKMLNSTSMLELFCLWHSRLGHINYKPMSKFMNQSLIPTLKIDIIISVKYVLKQSWPKHIFTQFKRKRYI